jgi:hypothetical protein
MSGGGKKESLMEWVEEIKAKEDFDPAKPRLMGVGNNKWLLLAGKPGSLIYGCSGIKSDGKSCRGQNVSTKTGSFKFSNFSLSTFELSKIRTFENSNFRIHYFDLTLTPTFRFMITMVLFQGFTTSVKSFSKHDKDCECTWNDDGFVLEKPIEVVETETLELSENNKKAATEKKKKKTPAAAAPRKRPSSQRIADKKNKK